MVEKVTSKIVSVFLLWGVVNGGLLVAGAQNVRPLVVRGPYIQMTTERSAVVVWRASRPLIPWVAVRTEPGAVPTKFVVPGEIVIRVSEEVSAPPEIPKLGGAPEQTFQYEAYIGGLMPDTVYYYEILNLFESISGGTLNHYFKTSPKVGDTRPFRFWTVGDTGDGSPAQLAGFEGFQKYLQSEPAATARRVDAYVHLGDMAYTHGLDSEFSANFFGIYQSLLQNTVTWATIGNHEGESESSGVSGTGPYFDAFVFPTRGEAGGVPSGSEAYYSFDHGDRHFICLDSYDLDRSAEGPMLQWLKADLEATNARWLIAFWHHPPYSKGTYDTDDVDGFVNIDETVEMRENVMPLLEAGGVDLVLCGHSHTYERSMLIDGAYGTPSTAEGTIIDDGDGSPTGDGSYLKNRGLQPNNGTVAIVAGHGRGTEHTYGPMTLMRRTVPVTGSVLVDVAADVLTGRMLDEHGVVRDEFQITKKADVEVTRVAHPWQVAGPKILITSEPGGSRVTMTPVPAAPDAEVRYTVDGTEPTRESPLYTSPVVLPSDSVHTVSAVTVWRSGSRISPAVSELILARSDDVILRETLDFRIGDFFGDWDEPADTGIAYPTHQNLPLGEEGIVALRFSNILVPDHSTLLFAQLQFGVGVEESRPARLKIEAELSPNPAPFATDPPTFATAARARTSMGIEWDPGTWTMARSAFGTQTPNLAPLLQEIIDQEDRSADAPALFLISGSGVREALSREWGPAIAPRLRIQFDRRSPLEIAEEGNQFSVRFESTAEAADDDDAPAFVFGYRALSPGGTYVLDYQIEASGTLESGGWIPVTMDSTSNVIKAGNPWEQVTARIRYDALTGKERYFRLRITAR